MRARAQLPAAEPARRSLKWSFITARKRVAASCLRIVSTCACCRAQPDYDRPIPIVMDSRAHSRPRAKLARRPDGCRLDLEASRSGYQPDGANNKFR